MTGKTEDGILVRWLDMRVSGPGTSGAFMMAGDEVRLKALQKVYPDAQMPADEGCHYRCFLDEWKRQIASENDCTMDDAKKAIRNLMDDWTQDTRGLIGWVWMLA